MTGRRTRTWLQACLFMGAASLVVYAFYVNRTLSARVASAERKSAQHAKQEEQLGNQLQGVSEHRSRLERQSHKDQELVNQLKRESTQRESDLKTQLQQHKDESSMEYSQLEKSYNALQQHHEQLGEQYRQMEDSYKKLSSNHSETVHQHNKKYSKLKEDKDTETMSLSDNLSRVKADRTNALANLRKIQEDLVQLNSRHAKLKSGNDRLKEEHSRMKAEEGKNLANYKQLSETLDKMKTTMQRQQALLNQYTAANAKRPVQDKVKPKPNVNDNPVMTNRVPIQREDTLKVDHAVEGEVMKQMPKAKAADKEPHVALHKKTHDSEVDVVGNQQQVNVVKGNVNRVEDSEVKRSDGIQGKRNDESRMVGDDRQGPTRNPAMGKQNQNKEEVGIADIPQQENSDVQNEPVRGRDNADIERQKIEQESERLWEQQRKREEAADHALWQQQNVVKRDDRESKLNGDGMDKKMKGMETPQDRQLNREGQKSDVDGITFGDGREAGQHDEDNRMGVVVLSHNTLEDEDTRISEEEEREAKWPDKDNEAQRQDKDTTVIPGRGRNVEEKEAVAYGKQIEEQDGVDGLKNGGEMEEDKMVEGQKTDDEMEEEDDVERQKNEEEMDEQEGMEGQENEGETDEQEDVEGQKNEEETDEQEDVEGQKNEEEMDEQEGVEGQKNEEEMDEQEGVEGQKNEEEMEEEEDVEGQENEEEMEEEEDVEGQKNEEEIEEGVGNGEQLEEDGGIGEGPRNIGPLEGQEEELFDQRDVNIHKVGEEEENEQKEDIEIVSELLKRSPDRSDFLHEGDTVEHEAVKTHDERSWEENPIGIDSKEVNEEGDKKNGWEKEEEEEEEDDDDDDYVADDGNVEEDGREINEGEELDEGEREQLDREGFDDKESKMKEEEPTEDDADDFGMEDDMKDRREGGEDFPDEAEQKENAQVRYREM